MADVDGKDKKGCCQKLGNGFSNFGQFLYNKETGQVMGRSGKSWAKIGFFYLIFYGFLAGFFSGMLAVFLTTLNDPQTGGPKLTQYVANQPGLSRVDQGSLRLLKYNRSSESTDVTEYNKKIETFLKKYTSSNICKTDPADEEKGMGEKDCTFDRTLLGPCANESFGLPGGEPCIFIKINKVYGWVPKSDDGKGFLTLKCNNEKAKIFPAGGFQISAFPFRGQKNFELPVVAVQFNVSEVTTVDCWLVGKGIERSESYVPYRAYGRIRIKE